MTLTLRTQSGYAIGSLDVLQGERLTALSGIDYKIVTEEVTRYIAEHVPGIDFGTLELWDDHGKGGKYSMEKPVTFDIRHSGQIIEIVTRIPYYYKQGYWRVRYKGKFHILYGLSWNEYHINL